MLRAYKIVTRYVKGRGDIRHVNIDERISSPAKIEIVIKDADEKLLLRVNKETTSPRVFFTVAFDGGLPPQLMAIAESYCENVGIKNLSSEPKERSIITHFDYFDSETSYQFSIYFNLLEGWIRRYCHIEIETSSEKQDTLDILDSLRNHLGLPSKCNELEYHIKDAEYYSQSALDVSKCVQPAKHVIELISIKADKSRVDYSALSHIYNCLAKAFNSNEKLLQTFNFATNFFTGGDVDIISLKELNYLYIKDGLCFPEQIAIYLQVLNLVSSSYVDPFLPLSTLKNELLNGEFIRLQTLVRQWEELLKLSTSKKSIMGNSIFKLRQNVEPNNVVFEVPRIHSVVIK